MPWSGHILAIAPQAFVFSSQTAASYERPGEFSELVERFERNADDYCAPKYGEAQTRIEFINPFFECLGWDIENRRGAAERFKGIIHEAALTMGGATKAPDFCFRIAGTRKFFLEATRSEE